MGKVRNIDEALMLGLGISHYLCLRFGLLDGEAYFWGLLLPSLIAPALSLLSGGRSRIAAQPRFRRACKESPRRIVLAGLSCVVAGYAISFYGGVPCGGDHDKLLFKLACIENAAANHHVLALISLYAAHFMVITQLSFPLAIETRESGGSPT